MNNRPQVTLADAFCNILRVSRGDPEILEGWVEEMEPRIALLNRFGTTLLGVFADDSALCLPHGDEPWFCGSAEDLIAYFKEFPHIAGQLPVELVEIINEYEDDEESAQ
jgi:hypothetical protein